jgi:hypothetical protein
MRLVDTYNAVRATVDILIIHHLLLRVGCSDNPQHPLLGMGQGKAITTLFKRIQQPVYVLNIPVHTFQ